MHKKCPNLYILIGIQGSGKSRWAMKRSGYYRVCPDDIRKKFFDDVSNRTDNISVHAIARGMVIAALELGHDTILDATNLNTPFRRRLFEKLPFHKRHAKIFEVDPEEAIQRIKKDMEEDTQRADVPESAVYRYHGDFLYTKKAILKEDFETINYIDQKSF